jgi:hypothetical protein
MRLGSLTVDPPLFLAPMAGITDRDFRLIVRRIGGVGMVGMEFLPAKGLVPATAARCSCSTSPTRNGRCRCRSTAATGDASAPPRGRSRRSVPTPSTSTWAAPPTRCSRVRRARR